MEGKHLDKEKGSNYEAKGSHDHLIPECSQLNQEIRTTSIHGGHERFLATAGSSPYSTNSTVPI